jgi:hypothetical protein
VIIYLVIIGYVVFHWEFECDVSYFNRSTVNIVLYQVKYVITNLANTLEVLKCGTGGGWRTSVGPLL